MDLSALFKNMLGGGTGGSNPTTSPGGGLLDNPMLIQYLAAAGSDLLSGNPIGQNVNQVTMQNLASQNYAKLLGDMLGNGGKLSMDKDNATLKFPTNAIGGGVGGGANGGSSGETIGAGVGSTPGTVNPSSNPTTPSATNPTQDPRLLAMMAGILNPTSSPLNISAANLAGLTPNDINSALGVKSSIEAAEGKRVSDYFDNLYKVALINQATSPKPQDPLDQSFPINVPNVGSVTLRQWKELPTDQQQYAAYVHEANRLGDSDIMSKQEFDLMKPTDKERFLRSAIKDPKLFEAAKQLAEAGSTKVDIGTQTSERIKATQKANIEGPGYAAKVIADLKKDARGWHNPGGTNKYYDQLVSKDGVDTKNLSAEEKLSYKKQAKKLARAEKIFNRLDSDIRAAYRDQNVELGPDGWYVDGKLIMRYTTNADIE